MMRQQATVQRNDVPGLPYEVAKARGECQRRDERGQLCRARGHVVGAKYPDQPVWWLGVLCAECTVMLRASDDEILVVTLAGT